MKEEEMKEEEMKEEEMKDFASFGRCPQCGYKLSYSLPIPERRQHYVFCEKCGYKRVKKRILG